MKGLAVFSTLPDLLYLWTDKQFENHLIQTALKQQLVLSADDLDESSLRSFAEHFFSPLVSSNKYMSQIGDSYRSMVCENGFIFVMDEVSSLYYVTVCGDGEESELFLKRKINVFHYLLRMFYGPCAHEHLRPTYSSARKQRWLDIEQVLISWQTLCRQEQMFLVESLERLHVNSQLNSVSLNLLGDVLIRTNRDGHTVHAMLLVNNKLLGLYSNENSPELQVSDILMLIVLVKNKFKYEDETVPTSIYRTPPILSDPVTQLKRDETLFQFHGNRSQPVNVGETESQTSSKFHSVSSTPNDHQDSFYTPRVSSAVACVPDSFDSNQSTTDEHDLSMVEADLELVLTSSDDENENNDEGINTPKGSTKTNKNSPVRDSPATDSTEVLDVGEETITKVTSQEEIVKYFQQAVFLQARDCAYTPHTAHCLLLDNSTVLIVVSQNRHMYLATVIQKLLISLNKILVLQANKVPSSRMKLLEIAEKCVTKVLNAPLRHPDLESEKVFESVKAFERCWKSTNDADLLSFLQSNQTAADMTSRLESCLEEMVKSTKSLFSCLFISSTQRRLSRYEKQLKVILNVREMALRRLRDFSMYLQVRGQRNVTMTAYYNDFPGLVHFIYVNRSIDQLIAPTINVNKDSSIQNKLPINIVIKQRIWDFWQYAETMVLSGYTSVVLREGDFTYSYFLWFEDSLGKPLHTQKSLTELYESKPTGVMSGSFYKNIIRHLYPQESPSNVHCFELLCMHIGAVSNHFIATSCRKLSKLLWTASGEGNGPVTLLL